MGNIILKLPTVPLRDLCLFPNASLHFDLGRKASIGALRKAMAGDELIFLVMQKSADTERPTMEQLYPIGTVARIKQAAKLPDGNMRVIAEGVDRASVCSYELNEDGDIAEVQILKSVDDRGEETEAIFRLTMENYRALMRMSGKMAPRLSGMSRSDACDLMANSIPVDPHTRQRLLSCDDVYERFEALYGILVHEIRVVEIQNSIRDRAKKSIEKVQKEYFLREQMNAIKKEMGDDDDSQTDELEEKVRACKMSDEARKKAEKELRRLKTMSPSSPEVTVSRSYIEWLTDIPWDERTVDNPSVKNARKVLDRDHYGMDKVKDRIIEFLAVKALTGSMKGPILCFYGPPGVGKTSIARSIASALGRKFVNMSLGGMRDEAELRGHRRTYIGSVPGRIVTLMKDAGTVNPVFLLDEIDKMASDYKGDPSSAMLEVLDPEQNHAFRDNYLDVPYDLSNVLFLTTANSLDTIPRPLLDRMEVINIEGYTDVEKCEIARRHLVPKQAKENGLSSIKFTITRAALMDIIDLYTREAGVRSLEREIARICRKAAVEIADMPEKPASVSIGKADVVKYLGAPKYLPDRTEKEPQVGLVNGLAWTAVGGVTLTIEANVMDGKGEIQLTGQLGDVMKESARAALSYIRANAQSLSIESDFYGRKDIHIHIPEGATPKDGPSAGITMALCMASALSGIPVRQDIAMTGEITLRGRVLPIGGLKEKTLAAYRAGIKTVLYPFDNEKDTEDIPKTVRDKLELIPVKTVDEVFAHALVR